MAERLKESLTTIKTSEEEKILAACRQKVQKENIECHCSAAEYANDVENRCSFKKKLIFRVRIFISNRYKMQYQHLLTRFEFLIPEYKKMHI